MQAGTGWKSGPWGATFGNASGFELKEILLTEIIVVILILRRILKTLILFITNSNTQTNTDSNTKQ